MTEQQIKALRHSTAAQLGKEAAALDEAIPAQARQKRTKLDQAAKLHMAANPDVGYVEAYKAIGGK